MVVKKININDIKAAQYNPRLELSKEDVEYRKIKNSIEYFGYIEPIVYNAETKTVVNGHQRFKILKEQGYKEIECVVVNLSEKDEKILNVSLNKIKGQWDILKLTDLLQEVATMDNIEVTGFEEWELKHLSAEYGYIDDLLNESFSDYAEPIESEEFSITFSCPADTRSVIEEYITNKENAKIELATAIINKVKGVI